MRKCIEEVIIGLSIFMFLLGIGNGLVSYYHYCENQYLDLRKPIHYVLFPHTVGYYFGRILGFPYGEDQTHISCNTIFPKGD